MTEGTRFNVVSYFAFFSSEIPATLYNHNMIVSIFDFLFAIFLVKLQRHRNSFITIEDFKFLYRHGINAVRIPVGWWIAFDPNPPAPFVGGALEALDNAFSWAQ